MSFALKQNTQRAGKNYAGQNQRQVFETCAEAVLKRLKEAVVQRVGDTWASHPTGCGSKFES